MSLKTPERECVTGFDTLRHFQSLDFPARDFSFAPNPDYDRYLRIHKVFVGNNGAEELIAVHHGLEDEFLPRYLTAAGWAAIEAGLVHEGMSTRERLLLIEKGENCWRKALEHQCEFNDSNSEYLIEDAFTYRTALDLAIAPLLKGVVVGDVTRTTAENVFRDCLNIAQAAEVQYRLAAERGDTVAIAEFLGFGYEANALLSLNRTLSRTWFAIPSMTRSDSGHHHRNQTHDLLVVHQNWGEIKSITPVEVKASACARDRKRYRALLVRGKMHLSYPGKYKPGDTLEAITAVYEGRATKEELEIAEAVSGRFISMLRDYYEGERLGSIATSRSVTVFHDNSVVASRHPGLSLDLKKAG